MVGGNTKKEGFPTSSIIDGSLDIVGCSPLAFVLVLIILVELGTSMHIISSH
jgi:hypothetical protein